jgi:hypothetical protein
MTDKASRAWLLAKLEDKIASWQGAQPTWFLVARRDMEASPAWQVDRHDGWKPCWLDTG